MQKKTGKKLEELKSYTRKYPINAKESNKRGRKKDISCIENKKKIAYINPTILIMMLNVNGLN